MMRWWIAFLFLVALFLFPRFAYAGDQPTHFDAEAVERAHAELQAKTVERQTEQIRRLEEAVRRLTKENRDLAEQLGQFATLESENRELRERLQRLLPSDPQDQPADSTEQPASQVFLDAMWRAESQLPPNILNSDAAPTPASAEELRHAELLYRRMLAAGEPVVLSHSRYRPLTIAFALQLSDSHRNEWMRRCVDQAEGSTLGDLGYGEIVRKYGAEKLPRYALSAGRRNIYEAVHNLSTDPLLKMEALNKWNAAAMRVHDQVRESHDRTRNDPNVWRTPPVPRTPVMPLWDLKEYGKGRP